MSIIQLKKAKKLAYKKQDLKEAAAICNALGVEFQESGDYEEALIEHQEEIAILEDIEDVIGVAVAHRRMGEVYTDLKKWNEALKHQKKHLSLAESCNNLVEQQRAFATLGRTHMQKAELAFLDDDKENQLLALREAEESFLKSLSLCDKIRENVDAKELSQMRCRIYHNIGLVLDLKGDISSAIKFVSQALEICDNYSLQEDAFRSFTELARMHMKIEKMQSALKEANSALNIGIKLQNKRYIIDSHFLIGQVNLMNDDFNAAKKSLFKAYKLKHPDSDTRELIIRYLKHVVVLCNTRSELSEESLNSDVRLKGLDKMGDALSNLGLFKQAISFYEKRLNLAIQIKEEPNFLAPIYTSLAQSHKDANDFDKALFYFDKELQIHLNGNPSEAIMTLIELAKLSEDKSSNIDMRDKMLAYIDQGLDIATNMNLPKLKLLLITTFIDSKFLPPDKYRILTDDLDNLKLICENDEPERSGEETEGESDIDLDLLDFSDSDEECIINKGRTRGNNKPLSLKANATGESPLHIATIKGNINHVKRLLDQNHPVNVRDNSGWLPIHEACNWGHTSIVELLIEAGAWINDRGGKECSGTTPLHDSASNGHFEIVKLLVQKGASACAKDDSGNTPLDCLLQLVGRQDLNDDEIFHFLEIQELLLNRMEKVGFVGIKNYRKKVAKVNSLLETSKVKENIELNSLVSEDISDCGVSYDGISLEKNCDSNPADIYRSAIDSLGSYSKTKNKQIMSNTSNVIQEKNSLVPEDDYVNDDWLIDDLGHTKKRKRSDKLEFEYKENRNTSNSYRNKTKKTTENTIKKKNKKQMKLSPYIFESHKESNVPKQNSNHDDINEVEIFESMPNATPSAPSSVPMTKPPLSLHVKVLNKKLLIPVSSNNLNQTIGWLEEEVSRRYSMISGVKLLIKLNTIYEEVLISEDSICSVLSPENCELLANVIGTKESLSLLERYRQVCSQFGIQQSDSILSLISNNEFSGKLDFSYIFLVNKEDFRALFASIQYQSIYILNLSSCRLEEVGIESLVECLPSLTFLEKLDMEACSISSEGLKSLSNYLRNNQSFNNRLNFLNLSYNDFSQVEFSIFINILTFPFLSTFISSSCGMHFVSNATSEVFSSNICSLTLDYNIIGPSVFDKIISSCPLLNHISFVNCLQSSLLLNKSVGLSLNAMFRSGSESLIQHIDFSLCSLSNSDIDILTSHLYLCTSLSYLNISGNSLINSSSILSLLTELQQNIHIPLSTLHLHNIKVHSEDENNFATCCALLVEKKYRSLYPFVSLKLPVFIDSVVLDTWKRLYDDKSICKIVKNVVYLSVRNTP